MERKVYSYLLLLRACVNGSEAAIGNDVGVPCDLIYSGLFTLFYREE